MTAKYSPNRWTANSFGRGVLGVGARRLRALALGDQDALRDWVAGESAYRLAVTRRDVAAAVDAIAAAGASVVTLAIRASPKDFVI